MGLPHVVTIDQGKEFWNDPDTELMKLLGVKHQLTTPYRPQVFIVQGCRNRGSTGARAPPSLQHRGEAPPSLQQTAVNKLVSPTTSLLVESQNTQLLHTLLECRPGRHTVSKSFT